MFLSSGLVPLLAIRFDGSIVFGEETALLSSCGHTAEIRPVVERQLARAPVLALDANSPTREPFNSAIREAAALRGGVLHGHGRHNERVGAVR